MKFIVKLFPEIIVKSHSVRSRFIKILSNNIRNIFRKYGQLVQVIPYWDCIEVLVECTNNQIDKSVDILTNIPGIHHILVVKEFIWKNIDDLYLRVLEEYRDLLIKKSFCVRIKRKGKHNFTSQDMERYIGSCLYRDVHSTHVKLVHPDILISLEINFNKLIIVIKRIEGIGGFPIGSQGEVLSLISGGFDSGVSSYMVIRRGCKVHYCFFDLSGMSQEFNIHNLAYHLWNRYGLSHNVKFITCNFESVVNEILLKITKNYINIILKRMMLRAASTIADTYGIHTLITGESVGQVSSQTIENLRLIDNSITNTLVLRPLISYDKEHIIQFSRKIDTEKFSKCIPEYCGIISKHSTAQASEERIKTEEKKFNFSILDSVIKNVNILDIFDINSRKEYINVIEIRTIDEIKNNDIILDIRTQDEQEKNPLKLKDVVIKNIPFYRLTKYFSDLDPNKNYLLYCDQCVMSRLQANYLYNQGFRNIKVFCPFL